MQKPRRGSESFTTNLFFFLIFFSFRTHLAFGAMPPRRVPPHAVVGQVVVDDFRGTPPATCTAFALTHAHADHYGGLLPRWSAGPVLATRVTAHLTAHLTGVAADVFVLLEWGVETPVPDAPGWSVTAFDAHHCPGASLLFFSGPSGERVLHTGDCRATPSLVADVAALVAEKGPLTALHLDTTYCHPRHAFPPAEAAIEAAVAAARSALATPGGCVAIQCYSCGKEPLLAALATLSPVGVSPRRAATLALAAPAVRVRQRRGGCHLFWWRCETPAAASALWLASCRASRTRFIERRRSGCCPLRWMHQRPASTRGKHPLSSFHPPKCARSRGPSCPPPPSTRRGGGGCRPRWMGAGGWRCGFRGL